MSPTCPPNYDCEFTSNPPDVPFDGPWWEGPWGIVVGILAVIVIAGLMWFIVSTWFNSRQSKRDALERERTRQQELAMAEQRTMQLDAAKGNPDTLKLIQSMQRGY